MMRILSPRRAVDIEMISDAFRVVELEMSGVIRVNPGLISPADADNPCSRGVWIGHETLVSLVGVRGKHGLDPIGAVDAIRRYPFPCWSSCDLVQRCEPARDDPRRARTDCSSFRPPAFTNPWDRRRTRLL